MNAVNAEIRELCRQLESICKAAKDLESDLSEDLERVHPRHRDSAVNLLHYIALRQVDLRPMQQRLHRLGLSSLGRAERHTRSSIRTVIKNLRKLYFDENCTLTAEQADFARSDVAFDEHVRDLLGDARDGRGTRIMVTLPSGTATGVDTIAELINAGMDIARINTAHDEPATWQALIDDVARANEATGASCEVVMDLAGAKIRTGQLKPGPRVRRVRPHRDALGRVIASRRLRLTRSERGPQPYGRSNLPVAGSCVDNAAAGDKLAFRDTRGKKRVMTVVAKNDDRLVVEIYKTAYIATGTRLKLKRKRKNSGKRRSFKVGPLPPIERPLRLRIGDTLVLHRRQDPGEPAVIDSKGNITQPAHIPCLPADVFNFVTAGASVRLNDGKIEGIVRQVTGEKLTVEITRAKATGSPLRGGKGINFPDSDIGLVGMSNADRRNLPLIARYASAVGLSFVKTPSDVRECQSALAALTDSPPGIILKIETEAAFCNLPRLLITAMRSHNVGVMIARGDLAVECGWERLAEIQEEMLWLCEAARVPVIWATQVLEEETRKGVPSRAEITDAAMAQRADCVMLNKGRYVTQAVRMLNDILVRMQGHQDKKTPKLRKLSVSDIDVERTSA